MGVQAGVWVWLQTELDDTQSCYQLIITLTKFVVSLFKIKTQEIPRFFSLAMKKKDI